MNEAKKISVVIPTLQEEKIIVGILSQFTADLKKSHNIELVISDGGSTDRTLEIARKYADVVVENKNRVKQNISIGRNTGARSSSGDILVFINGDTLISDINFFFTHLRKVIELPSVKGITAPVYIYPEIETFADNFFHNFLNVYFYFLNVIGLGMGRGECHVVKRAMFDQVGGYDERVAAGEDFDFFRRVRRYGKIKFDWKLRVFESPRRYRKSGYLKIILLWLLNAITVLLFKKSIVDEWKPVR
ncbi:MAG: glycosyltransferase [Bacteroidota bacterium]|nr:glycosyltransferase [Bacteroidota bacterium]